MSGTLYIVATPIGNLEDITLRALRVLKEVDLVAAEDTRHSRRLLTHFGIGTKLTSYFEHNESTKGERLLEELRAGRSVALISDAGTPAISDPGYFLVRRCRDEGIAVVTVPGPSAVIAALSISGLPTDRFTFEGFLPAKSAARRGALRALAHEKRTAVFYEALHRLAASLRDLAAELGEGREVAVARELTKMHEELFRGSVADALERFGVQKVRGEIVLLVAPVSEEKKGEMQGAASSIEDALRKLLTDELPLRQAAKAVAKEFGLPKDEVYRIGLSLKDDDLGSVSTTEDV